MVILSVEDVNDNAPIFYPTAYNVTVRQGILPGTSVLVVSASDLDDGQLGTVTYAIASGNDAGVFRVDKTTGMESSATPYCPTVTSFQANCTLTNGSQ